MKNAITEVVDILSKPGDPQDFELCVTRLEVLAENALRYDGIPLEVADLLNQGLNVLKRISGMERTYGSYQAPVLHNERNTRNVSLVSFPDLVRFE